MVQGVLHTPVTGGGLAAKLLMLATGPLLSHGGLTNAGDGIVEPLDPAVEARLPGMGSGGLG